MLKQKEPNTVMAVVCLINQTTTRAGSQDFEKGGAQHNYTYNYSMIVTSSAL